jgi:hypothetical protein
MTRKKKAMTELMTKRSHEPKTLPAAAAASMIGELRPQADGRRGTTEAEQERRQRDRQQRAARPEAGVVGDRPQAGARLTAMTTPKAPMFMTA